MQFCNVANFLLYIIFSKENQQILFLRILINFFFHPTQNILTILNNSLKKIKQQQINIWQFGISAHFNAQI